MFRNNNSTYNIKFNTTNNDIIYDYSNKSKNVYVKPYIKKEESQKYFTSNKKKEKDIKFFTYKKIKSIKEQDDYNFKNNLKKQLFFEDNDYYE